MMRAKHTTVPGQLPLAQVTSSLLAFTTRLKRSSLLAVMSNSFGSINVAVEGCCHGELDAIYKTIKESEARGVHVDLLLVCGDFQCVRDYGDLECVAMPPKYRKLNTFHEYLCGQKVAPVPTIFIGGNHEASNILQDLYYGGWVAPNIYFLGFAGVVWFGGIKIAGCSGIYNGRHYRLGHYERPPYSDDSMRSIYHLRELEVYRMSHLANSGNPIDIFLSHDWPENVWEYGDKATLLRKKPFLQSDMASGQLGSPPLAQLLELLRPSLWFAAHLHVKFAAIVPHHHEGVGDNSIGNQDVADVSKASSVGSDAAAEAVTATATGAASVQSGAGAAYCQPVGASATRFLSLDKVLPGRDFLQIVAVPRQRDEPLRLHFDPAWLATLRKTHALLKDSRYALQLPDLVEPPSVEEVQSTVELIHAANGGSLIIPEIGAVPLDQIHQRNKQQQEGNSQTDFLLQAFGLPHIWTKPAVRPQQLYTGGEMAPIGYAGGGLETNTNTTADRAVGTGRGGEREEEEQEEGFYEYGQEGQGQYQYQYTTTGNSSEHHYDNDQQQQHQYDTATATSSASSASSASTSGQHTVAAAGASTLFDSLQGLTSAYGNQQIVDRLVGASATATAAVRSASDPHALDIDEDEETAADEEEATGDIDIDIDSDSDSAAFRPLDEVLDKPLSASIAATHSHTTHITQKNGGGSLATTVSMDRSKVARDVISFDDDNDEGGAAVSSYSTNTSANTSIFGSIDRNGDAGKISSGTVVASAAVRGAGVGSRGLGLVLPPPVHKYTNTTATDVAEAGDSNSVDIDNI